MEYLTLPELENFWKDVKSSLNLHKQTNISKLKIEFEGCEKLTDETFDDIAKKIGKTFTNVQSLELSFFPCDKITNQGIAQIGKQIARYLHDLKSLILSINRAFLISSAGVKLLTKEFGQQFYNITDLHFHIGSKAITDTCLNMIGRLIFRRLVSLKRAQLSLIGCKITNEGMSHLVRNAQKRRAELVKMIFNFAMCSQISHKAVEILHQELSFIPRVRVYL